MARMRTLFPPRGRLVIVLVALICMFGASWLSSTAPVKAIALCAPTNGPSLTPQLLFTKQTTLNSPQVARLGQRGVSPNYEVTTFRTSLYGLHNACGVVTEIYGVCETDLSTPGNIASMECELQQNSHKVWNSGWLNRVGTYLAEESPAYTVGPSGTVWRVGMAAAVVYPNMDVAATPGYPSLTYWQYWTVP